MDKNTLSHTTWECKYHIVFAPKYRRQVIYGNIKADIANILSTLCKRKNSKWLGTDKIKAYKGVLQNLPGSVFCSTPVLFQNLHLIRQSVF